MTHYYVSQNLTFNIARILEHHRFPMTGLIQTGSAMPTLYNDHVLFSFVSLCYTLTGISLVWWWRPQAAPFQVSGRLLPKRRERQTISGHRYERRSRDNTTVTHHGGEIFIAYSTYLYYIIYDFIYYLLFMAVFVSS